MAGALTIPVAGGEQESSDWRFRRMIANRGVDVVEPDLFYSGGFGFVYMLHYASCLRIPVRHQAYELGTIPVQDGKMTVPTGPGVGVKDLQGLLKGALEVA